MTFTGHAGPGVIRFCSDPETPSLGAMTQLATTRAAAAQSILSSVILSDIPEGSMDDVLLVVLLACNTGTDAPDGSTLQNLLPSKGVEVVIAFPGKLHSSLGGHWEKRFWRLATGQTVPGQGTLCGHVLPTESGHCSVIDVCCGFVKNPHPASLFHSLHNTDYYGLKNPKEMKQFE